MIKMLATFFIFFAIFYTGIEIFRMMSGKEKWKFIKTISYSMLISLIVIVFLTALVVLF
jgi:hypothetical protein